MTKAKPLLIRFPQALYLPTDKGTDSEFQVGPGSSKATEHLPFEHLFDPEGVEPVPPF